MSIHFGVDYYPEHWPKFSAIAGIWLCRNYTYISHNGNCQVRCRKSILGTPTAAPPAWIIERNPEIQPIDREGRRRHFGGRPDLGKIVKSLTPECGSPRIVQGFYFAVFYFQPLLVDNKVNYYDLGKLLDFVSNDIYPAGHWQKPQAHPDSGLAASHNFDGNYGLWQLPDGALFLQSHPYALKKYALTVWPHYKFCRDFRCVR